MIQNPLSPRQTEWAVRLLWIFYGFVLFVAVDLLGGGWAVFFLLLLGQALLNASHELERHS